MTYYRKNLGWNNNTCKIAKLVGDNILSLPLYPSLTIKKLNDIKTRHITPIKNNKY